MSVADLTDALEAYDTVCPCPSNEELRRDWFAEFTDSLPWDEIDSGGSAQEALDFVEECMTVFTATAGSAAWSVMPPEERVARVEALMALPQVPQRTRDWYLQGRQVLTASEFATILGTPRAVGVLAVHKAAPLPEGDLTNRLACATTEMGPMDWGVRFEPIVKQILTARWGAEIVELGRLLHPTDPRLAASPDGLILRATDPDRVGRLVEIKCPIRREITGQIPFEYWCQMQIQMEVADIDECEYVEVKLNSAYKAVPMCAEARGERHLYSGTMWLLQHPDTLDLCYAHTDLELADLGGAGWCIVETIPWNLDGLYTQVVRRDRAWFAGTEAARAAFWEKVEAARAGTFVAPPSSRPARVKAVEPTVVVCKIED